MTKYLAALAVLGCAACAPTLGEAENRTPEDPPANSTAGGTDGGYYLDDGPPPDAGDFKIAAVTPKWEKINPRHNRPYQALGNTYRPYTALRPYRKKGAASWYGRRYHGNKTASGEVYDMFKLTAAHPILVIPSYARVTNLSNGKIVTVRINDRGPFLRGREIDLSYAAARILGFADRGTAEVLVETIIPVAAGETANTAADDLPRFYIQLGAFSLRSLAEKLRTRFLAETSDAPVHLLAGDDKLYRVKAGPFATRREAARRLRQWCAKGWCGVISERL